jgi:SAM-dependent methyltransferase
MMMDTKAIVATLGGNFDVVATDGACALRELPLNADATVLDVGTGKGNFAIFLASQGFQVLTGEPSTDDSRYARQEWAAAAEKVGLRDRIRFEHFEANRMPFPSASFDAVFFFGVLHHIDEAVRNNVMRESLRVAKEDGAVVFFEPRKAMLERVWQDDPHHPLAAIPSQYLHDAKVNEQRIEGAFMDIFIYRKS